MPWMQASREGAEAYISTERDLVSYNASPVPNPRRATIRQRRRIIQLATSITSSRTNGILTIKVKGKFTFESHLQFKKALLRDDEEAQSKITRFIVDLSGTEYIDSSALGLLLILREEVTSKNSTIEISHARPEVYNVLKTANFHKLFKIV
jgi:anti-anti-sigma factor